MRAIEPATTGYAERDGVKLHWEEFGDGDTTIVLLPTWSLIDSRFWKAQVPYLARHFRVVTFDGRGCGRSDRPAEAEAYSHLEFAADTIAVLDATNTPDAVLVGLSCGTLWGVQVAADRPDRVRGLIFLGPQVPLAPTHSDRTVYPFAERLDTTEGWAKYNRYHWLEGGYRDFLEFFARQGCTEPHSTKQIEDIRRVGARHRAGDVGGQRRGAGRVRAGEFPLGLPAGASTRAGDSRRRRRTRSPRQGRSTGGGHRRRTGHGRRRGSLSPSS